MSEQLENKESVMLSLRTLNKMSKSLCKIMCQNKGKTERGTGFFMVIKYEKKKLLNCLVTNCHIKNYNSLKVWIKIGQKKESLTFKLINSKKRIIKYFNDPVDITLIEILDDDLFKKNVAFLSYDLNYLENGYNYYLNKEICLLKQSYWNNKNIATGKIISINDYEFDHNAIINDNSSSGSPIILIENNCILGINKKTKKYRKNNKINQLNVGIFISKLFNEIIMDLKPQNEVDIKIEKNFFEGFENGNTKDNKTENNISKLRQILEEIDNRNNFDNDNLSDLQNKNMITLEYIILENKDYITLFSKTFIKTNENNFIMFINDKKYYPCCQLDISKINVIDNILEVKLKIIYEIKNFKNMFEDTDLLFISGFSGLERNNIESISHMFRNCLNLFSILDIDFLNTSKVTKMNGVFQNCESLEFLPDLSKWDTSQVTNMSNMFSGCKKLKKLPDISNWNTSKVIDMNHMFSKCTSLLELPDISKWDLRKVQKLNHLFYECESLKNLPDIEKWSLIDATTISFMFYGCKSLTNIPEISKWKTKKITNMNEIFANCNAVKKLPDISNALAVEEIKDIFSDYKSFEYDPNISFLSKKYF